MLSLLYSKPLPTCFCTFHLNFWTGVAGGGGGGELSIAILTLTPPINFNMPTKSALVLETKGSFVLLFHSHTSLSERDHIDHDKFYYYFFHFF